MSKEWPILFSAPLVIANRAGRKNVTRRLFPKWKNAQPGDLLMVRETWRAERMWDNNKPSDIGRGSRIWYEADGPAPDGFGKLRPSIFLPRWASRDVYPILSVREERLQDITEEEARAEGFMAGPAPGLVNGQAATVAFFSPLHWFAATWDAINPETPFASNPTVYRIAYANPVKP